MKSQKLTAVLLAATLAAASLNACGGKNGDVNIAPDAKSPAAAGTEANTDFQAQ